MSSKRILVTGGFGYVGSRLTPHLLALGHHVRVIDLLLYTDAALARARRQLWPRYGHFRFGRTAAMDAFLDRYETWLAESDADSSCSPRYQRQPRRPHQMMPRNRPTSASSPANETKNPRTLMKAEKSRKTNTAAAAVWSASPIIPGPATCASSRTPWSAR